MDKQQHLDLANDYANEADELEAGELEEALDLLKVAAENVKGAAIDRAFQKEHEEAAEKDA